MLMISWIYTIAAISITSALFIYINFHAAKTWGDSIQVIKAQQAVRALISIDKTKSHVKNWKPHILALSKLIYKLIKINYLKNFFF